MEGARYGFWGTTLKGVFLGRFYFAGLALMLLKSKFFVIFVGLT
jgi:hypothetical protein